LNQNFYDDFDKTVASKEGTERVQYSKAVELGTDKETGLPIYAKEGQHGCYLQIGDAVKGDKETKTPSVKPFKISPIPKGVRLEDVTLEKAMYYLQVPRTLGNYKDIPVNVGIGKFGSYLLYNKKYYSIKPSYEISVYDIVLEQAITIINTVDDERANSLLWFKENTKYGDISIINGLYGPYIYRTGVGGGYKKGNFKLPKNLSTDDIKKLPLEKVEEFMLDQPKPNANSKWKKKE